MTNLTSFFVFVIAGLLIWGIVNSSIIVADEEGSTTRRNGHIAAIVLMGMLLWVDMWMLTAYWSVSSGNIY